MKQLCDQMSVHIVEKYSKISVDRVYKANEFTWLVLANSPVAAKTSVEKRQSFKKTCNKINIANNLIFSPLDQNAYQLENVT